MPSANPKGLRKSPRKSHQPTPTPAQNSKVSLSPPPSPKSKSKSSPAAPASKTDASKLDITKLEEGLTGYKDPNDPLAFYNAHGQPFDWNENLKLYRTAELLRQNQGKSKPKL